MKRSKKTILLLKAITVVAALCTPYPGSAQDYKAIAEKYKNEQAVIVGVKETLTIEQVHGSLVASTHVAIEKMLISSLAPAIHNKMYIFHSYFHQLEDHNEEALIAVDNKYKTRHDFIAKTSPVEQSNVFYDDTKETEISYTGLTPGSILKSDYTISHRDLHILPSFYLQKNIPVLHATYEVIVPNYVNIKFVVKGSSLIPIKKDVHEGRNTITYTFTADDLPTFKDYPDVPSGSWYEPHVVPYIASYKMPGEPEVQLLSDPAHLYAYYYNFVRNVNTKPSEKLSKVVADITRDMQSPTQKAERIYKWVQNNIHYIAFEDSLGGFIPREAATICERKFGDCKDMASILVAMCRAAGIDAYFTWIGTRDKPYTYEETPAPIVDNHMICAIKIAGKWIFLDGTHPFIPFGITPAALQDKEAMICIDEKKFELYTIPETAPEYNITIDTTTINLNGKEIKGRTTVIYKGEPSWNIQAAVAYSAKADVDNLLKNMNTKVSNKYMQTNSEFTKSDTGYKDSRLTADYTIGDYLTKANNEFFINMHVDRYFDDRHIDTARRNIPVYFAFRAIERECVILTIPEGYHVSYLPPDDSASLNDTWSYTVHYRKDGRSVILSKEYVLHSMSIAPKDFAAHNKIIDKLRKQYKESVVLTPDL